MEKCVPYRAYLIRIWETRRGGVAGYRAVVVDVATRERKDFPDLESLFDYLAVPAVGEKVTPDRKSEPGTEN